jgi:hypothetical protein
MVMWASRPRVAFEGVGEAAEGFGDPEGGLADDAANAATQTRYGQAEIDGFVAEGHGPNGAFDGAAADDVVGLAGGTAIVFGILFEMEGDDRPFPRGSDDLVIAAAEGLA